MACRSKDPVRQKLSTADTTCMDSVPLSAMARARGFVADWLPHGRTLPDASWRVRHRAVIILLVLHAVVLGIWAALEGRSGIEVVVDASVPALGAYAASRTTFPRAVRSSIAATCAMLTSSIVVHLM